MDKITAESLAKTLDGREYRSEITKEEEQLAKENGLVVVFGRSDDLMELCGAIDGEEGFGGSGGFTFFINKDGIKTYGEVSGEKIQEPTFLTAYWNRSGYSWCYKINVPSSSFDILEEGQKYCRGIVFNISELS